jgi:hypothetical protein
MNGEEFASGLLAIAAELEGLTEAPRRVAAAAAPKIAAVIDDELARGVGPQGSAWPALKDGSGRVPFSSSDRMRGRIKVEAQGLVVKGKLLAPWNVHQYGSSNPKKGVPARKVYQTGELSPSWEKALEEANAEVLEEMTSKTRAAGG